MKFAVERNLINPNAADEYLTRAMELLFELGTAQAELQEQSKPGRRFLDLIASALQSKRCHLVDAHSDKAPMGCAGACGWHRDLVFQGRDVGNIPDWGVPGNSKRIGFIDVDNGIAYLDPTESQAIAQDMIRQQGETLSLAKIGRELLQEQLVLRHVENGSTRSTGQHRIKHFGKKRYFWVKIEDLFGENWDHAEPALVSRYSLDESDLPV
jgi:hypothetical protein